MRLAFALLAGLAACKPGPAKQPAGSPADTSAASPRLASTVPLPPPPEAGWYGKEQADSGAQLFAAKCSVCHGQKLEGGAGPALVGPQFFARFGGDPMSRLWYGVHTEMPLTAPASLPANESLDIVAYILRQNGFPAGPYRLIGHYDLNRIIPKASPGGPDVAGVPLASAPDTTIRQPTSSAPSQAELAAADTTPADWLTYGKGYRGARYSTLTDITAATAASLKPVCAVPLGEDGAYEGGPVAHNGILYVTTTHLTLAIDGATCAIRWRHQYVSSALESAANNKGVAIGGGRVIRGTPDGHLLALDLETGSVLWVRPIMDSRIGESAQAAPLIWNDLVFMPKAGSDVGIRGETMAFKVTDGSKVWGFATIPMGKETGAESWPEAAAAHGGGGTWTYLSIDPASGTLHVPVGNAFPDFVGDGRSGANLFTAGIVALDAATGRLKWWYQTQPHDVHDWDATGSAVFTPAGGKTMIAATAKDGDLHLLDAATGKLQSRTSVTTHKNDQAPLTTAGTHFCPGPAGGMEWNGAAFSSTTGLVYVNSVDWCVTVKLTGVGPNAPKMSASSFGGGIPVPDSMSLAHGWTTAIDPKTGKVRWKVRQPTPMLAAVTPTMGGVLFTGTMDGHFLALDAATGKTLYEHDTGGAMVGGVITYVAGGKQYVAAASGNTSFIAWRVTGKPTLVIFGL